MNEQTQSNLMVVWFNGEETLHYDRQKPLPILQHSFVDRMERKMDGGITLDGEHVENPDRMQRARFVAEQLAGAIQGDDESAAAAMCTYLAKKLPELRGVRFESGAGGVATELVFNEYRPN